MYQYYFTDSAKGELAKLSKNAVDKVHDALECLSQGIWKNGVRVKRLQGINHRKLYEARLDKANRMLFMVGKAGEELEAALYVVSPFLKHDDVIRRARHILGDEFDVSAYQMAKELATNTSIEKIDWEDSSEVDAYEYTEEYIRTEKIYRLSLDDFYRLLNEDALSSEALMQFKLKMNPEQEAIYEKSAPLLIAGTAGSGKTTILLYKLLDNPAEKKLYLTYSQELVKESRLQFEQLIIGRDEKELLLKNTEFLTFNELIQQHCDLITLNMTRERFIADYKKYAQGGQKDKHFRSMMVWEEIRSIWKSRLFGYPVQKNLSLKDYLEISHEEAPNFYERRKEAYQIFQWYEGHLDRMGLMDEIDLVAQCIQEVKKQPPEYRMVICDEVQDLTNIHIQLVFELASRKANRIVMAGDDHQVVQYTGFRWENLKRAFHQELKAHVEYQKLNQNFRNTGHIINLANLVDSIQWELADFDFKTRSRMVVDSGRKPVLCEAIPEAEMFDLLEKAGPEQVVIVKDENEKTLLRQKFECLKKRVPLIFPIDQTKGLEFGSVVLWRIISSGKDVLSFWDKLVRNGYLEENRGQQLDTNTARLLRNEISQLYVSITRGMQECIIYEGETIPSFWAHERFSKNLEKHWNLFDVSKYISKDYTGEDWCLMGERLMNKRLFADARQCFERAYELTDDMSILQVGAICSAQLLIDEGNLEEAALVYEKHLLFHFAAECYVDAGLYGKAAQYYGTNRYGIKDMHQYYTYKAMEFDAQENWHDSATMCVMAHRPHDAAVRFLKSGSAKDLRLAAHWFEQCSRYEDAIALYEQLGIGYETNIKKCLEALLEIRRIAIFPT